uniref:Amino acid transporter transmembrane domain-containing protein n=1 Tax=Pseudictyota dubia TaxID=2749911 RepID=A0A7R9ZBJ0_9STRA|mmetsp:Transcript_36934/g.68421  ORF Transcript_36934/g.68421 Transcript_36934/m.68421 type:complete len:606 (+) Transcript_36934:136-1953(+)
MSEIMEEVPMDNDEDVNANGGVGELPTQGGANGHGPPARSDSMLNLPKKKSGVFGASSNLVNSIVGAGIIGIPYAIRQSGFIAGLFLLGLVGFLTDRSLRVIVNLASFHPLLKGKGIRTFEKLASYPFGRVGSGFILTNMLIMAYGAMVAYMIIIKDTVPTVLGVEPGSIGRQVILIITSLAIMVPLAMMRDMASLSFTSMVSVLADIILVGFVAGYAPIEETLSQAGGFGEVLKENWIKPSLFIGLGIISTAMACQHSAFIVSGSLENKTQRRWSTVTVISITFASVLCAAMGICGYLGFLGETQGDILNNFPGNSVASNGARMLLAITMFFTYPMESFVARHVLVMLLHQGDMDAVNNEGGRYGGGYLCMNRRHSWTLALYLAALLPGLFLDDLGPVLSITGSLGGSCIAYVAPGLVYLGVNGEAFQDICRSMALNWSHKHDDKIDRDAPPEEAGLELPVAGDANQRMAATNNGDGENGAQQPGPADLPVAGEKRTLSMQPDFAKPFWWYLGLFPIWWAIASSGRMGMQEKLGNMAETQQPPSPEEGAPADEDTTDHVDVLGDQYPPTKGGFCMAIFFILFGVLGVIVGLLSNIAAQFSGPEP